MNENMMNSPMNDNSQMNAADSQNRSNMVGIVGIIAVVAVVAFIIMQMLANNAGTPTIETQPETDTDEEMMMDDDVMTTTPTEGVEEEIVSEDSEVSLTVEGGSFYFQPNIIRVNKGATVTITLESVDMMHDFVIDELGVESAIIPAGKSTTVTFVADEAGEFEFYCSVGNHRAMGMVGTLIVEE